MLEKTNRIFFWKLVVPKPRGGLVQGCQKKTGIWQLWLKKPWNLQLKSLKHLEIKTTFTCQVVEFRFDTKNLLKPSSKNNFF